MVVWSLGHTCQNFRRWPHGSGRYHLGVHAVGGLATGQLIELLRTAAAMVHYRGGGRIRNPAGGRLRVNGRARRSRITSMY